MNILARFYQNHVLANLFFLLVLVVGFLSYHLMPREQDPNINFNWIDITTVMPGASASDVEKRVTDILEDAIRTVSDIKFVSSTSREGISSILVRFNDDINQATFDKRVTDLRREIQNVDRAIPIYGVQAMSDVVADQLALPRLTTWLLGSFGVQR